MHQSKGKSFRKTKKNFVRWTKWAFFFRRKLTTMQKIQIKVEQVSKQAFIEGWNKADPQIVNQIANLWYPKKKKTKRIFFTICLFNGTLLIVFSQPVNCKMFFWLYSNALTNHYYKYVIFCYKLLFLFKKSSKKQIWKKKR